MAAVTHDAPTRHHRPPPWRDVRLIRIALQVAFVVVVALVLIGLYRNLVNNLDRLGIRSDFGFLDQPAGFVIPGTDFRASQPISEALRTGIGNTLQAAIPGIVLAFLLGVVVGIARLSANWLVRRTAGIFVESMRNVPLLVLLIFLYLAVLQRLPRISDAAEPLGLLVLSNRGLYLPWFELAPESGAFLATVGVGLVAAVLVGIWRTRQFVAIGTPHHRVLWGGGLLIAAVAGGWLALDRPVSPSLPVLDGRLVTGGLELTLEYGALLFALILYTAGFIAEIVRGAIQAVPKGQSEAASSLGLSAMQRLRYVVLPQALRIATPPIGNEFLNLSKNVSLGIAIAFPELLRVARQAIGNGMPAPQLVLITLAGYLLLSMVIAAVTNLANRRLQLVER